MAPMSEPAPKHIPAWKKIGLKLEYAKEEPEDSDRSRNWFVNGTKRKAPTEGEFTAEATPTDSPTKKSKRSKSHRQGDSEPVNRESIVTTIASTQELPQPAIKVTPASKRKSVAFTPETKTEDGDSVNQLYKTWYSSQLANNSSFDPSSASPALRINTPPSISPQISSTSTITKSPHSPLPLPSKSKPKSKKFKQKKKVKSNASPNPQPTLPLLSHPALSYLDTHHTSPSTWKFSKPYQNYLLKHLFSLTNIPHSYDPALLSYLYGLQGTSARSRIRKQALAVRSEDEEWLNLQPTESEKMDKETDEQCHERKKRDYEAAVKRVKKMLRVKEDAREEREWDLSGEKEEWEERMRKRRRAEVVLWGVGEDEEVVEDAAPVTQPRDSMTRKDMNGNGEPEYPKGRGKGMGGVEEIGADGIAKASQGKKIKFGDDGVATANAANGVRNTNGIPKPNGKATSSAGQVKGKRKRKRRTRAPDDDDDSSSASSSSSSDESEGEKQVAAKQQMNGNGKGNLEKSSSSGPASDSESVSDTVSGSSEDSDSE
ncbi:hypothetical protein N7G274_002085 [Stereocaulon virgatum]|uniref:WKF domain-containing protein n=1 Tax=Stereocaulon virgatum TaxID=373712 RepID=A0ABR4AJH8_9LECA